MLQLNYLYTNYSECLNVHITSVALAFGSIW